MSTFTVGVNVGGTKVLGGVVDEDGNVLAQARRETPADDTSRTLDYILEVIEELASTHEISAVGIGAAGWIDEKRSRVLFAPNLAWRNEPLRDRLAARTPYPVVVENDGNAAAWAEFRFGAARQAAGSSALVTIGTGIGGGIVVGGEIIRGAFGIAAEPGHMRSVPDGRPCPCGRHGCLEQYASGNALVRAAQERATADPSRAPSLLELVGGQVDLIDGPHVTRAARDGDAAALAAFGEIAGWLGAGLADLAYLLDPEILVIGGGVVDAGELLMEPTRAAYAAALAPAAPCPSPASCQPPWAASPGSSARPIWLAGSPLHPTGARH